MRNELTIANEPDHHTRGTSWSQLRHQLYNHPNLDTHEGWPVCNRGLRYREGETKLLLYRRLETTGVAAR